MTTQTTKSKFLSLIGATLREEDGYIKVVKIVSGSAAYRQGKLAADDIILKVAEGAGVYSNPKMSLKGVPESTGE